MSGEDNPRPPLDGILDGLAESIANEEPQELLDEARSAGHDTEVIAQKLKRAAMDRLKKLEQKKLYSARQAHQRNSQRSSSGRDYVAPTPEERKQQLFALMKSSRDVSAAITAQYRNFEELSDKDIESSLLDFAELGLLGDAFKTPDSE
jgi:hypothetical protein